MKRPLLILAIAFSALTFANADVQPQHAQPPQEGPLRQELGDTGSLLENSAKDLSRDIEHGVQMAQPHNPHEARELLTPMQWEMVWTIVVFLVFFGVLSFLVWPKILVALRDRESKQRNDLTEAENAANEAKATLEQYKQQLAEAHKEAQRIIEQSRKDAEQIAATIKTTAEHDIAQMKQRAQQDIKAARDQAVSDIFNQAATLVTQAAGQILKREINAADHQQLIDASLKELHNN